MTDTQLAQMALSAIARSGEKVDIITLSEVLRGKSTRSVKSLGLDQIKTFGVGKEWSKEAWFYMLIQMLQQGLFVIDYKENYALKMSEDGRKVLKGELEVHYEDHGNSAGISFKRNGIQIFIAPDICDAIDWKTITQSLQSKVYWNYQGDRNLSVSYFIPAGIADYEKVKSRFFEIVRDVFQLEVKDDVIYIPKKDDFDINGVLVEPLKLPFDKCLQMLREFIEKNGHYPSMKAEEDEVTLRKWFREAWHGIIPVTEEQKEILAQFTKTYPIKM